MPAHDHTISGLKAKRAELTGKIEYLQTQLRQLMIDLDNLDATLRIFDPEIDLEDIRPKPMPPRHHAFRGQLSRIILDALRASPEPMSSLELAERIMALRELNLADKRLVRTMTKRVGACLRNQRDQGVVSSEYGEGVFKVWKIAR